VHVRVNYRYVLRMVEIEQIAKLEAYLKRVKSEVDGIKFYPRRLDRYPFDTIASSMISKGFALSSASVTLLREDLPDEAYGLSRSVVEGALILRYLTSDPSLQHDRAIEFAGFSFSYKNFWLHHAREQFAGKPEITEIERHARQWKLTGDPKPAMRHWSKLRSFTWEAQTMPHPLDGPSLTQGFKIRQYAVDYFQTSQWVHCSQPALDNYVPELGRPFVVSGSSQNFGNPAHSVLYILLVHVHGILGYALFGLGIDRTAEIDSAFSETLAVIKPIGT